MTSAAVITLMNLYMGPAEPSPLSLVQYKGLLSLFLRLQVEAVVITLLLCQTVTADLSGKQQL